MPSRDVSSVEMRIEPGLVSKAAKYLHAVSRWVAAGMPSRSDDEVETIYGTFCVQCPYFNAPSKRCKICGCRLRNPGVIIASKIRMATEHCPKDKW